MVTTLYLIRHGETEGAETKRYKGSIDVPLSQNGISEMGITARFVHDHAEKAVEAIRKSYLSDIHASASAQNGDETDAAVQKRNALDAVYSSDLQRAIKSAEIFAKPFGLMPEIVPALRERHFGIWEGMSFSEIKKKYPDGFSAWAKDPLANSPIGGETTLQVKERVIPALKEIISRHAGRQLAVVSHGGVIRVALCHFLGMPLSNIFRIEQDTAAVNIIEFWEAYPVVKLINGGPRTARD